jgi:hypothetical protein
MPLRRITVRLPTPVHDALSRNAAREGVSLAQYVREAALMRGAWEAGCAIGEEDAAAIRAGVEELNRRLDRGGELTA